MNHPVHERRGLRRAGPAGIPAILRWPAAWLYEPGARLFHSLHDAHLLPRRHAPVPVVSVGALTAGGSGKTPFVGWLARRLGERGHRPAVLSRGYRARGGPGPRIVDPQAPDAGRDGDEPALLARSLPGIPVIVCPDRVRAAALARGRGADVVLLDDGFQHRRLYRDVDVVLWDRGAEGSRGRLLPRGQLREPLRALRRADALVLVDRGDGAPAPPPPDLQPARVFRVRLVSVARQEIEAGRRVHALTGVADPGSFERSLERLGLRVTGATRYPDHHSFTRADVLRAMRSAEEEGADFLAVTAKDHVRWPWDPAGGIPVPAVFDLDVEMESEDAFLESVEALLEERVP